MLILDFPHHGCPEILKRKHPLSQSHRFNLQFYKMECGRLDILHEACDPKMRRQVERRLYDRLGTCSWGKPEWQREPKPADDAEWVSIGM